VVPHFSNGVVYRPPGRGANGRGADAPGRRLYSGAVMPESETKPVTQPPRRRARYVELAVLCAVVATGSIGLWWWVSPDRAALQLLRSDDPAAWRRGAELAEGARVTTALPLISDRLSRNPDAATRETLVWALGRMGNPADFDLVARHTRTDDDAYVRHAAWVAAARLDAVRFRDLAQSAGPSRDPWDEIGQAYGWLEIGEVRGLDTLFKWAVSAPDAQRHGAVLVLQRRVAPLLEAVGRWPVDLPFHEGADWSPEVVTEVQRRCRLVDLSAIARDSTPHAARIQVVHRAEGKLLRARERLARCLAWL